MKKTTFQRGSGCYVCRVCKRQTRDTGDNGGVELCPPCYELAGIENTLMDAPESWPENPSEEQKAVWARYEEEINEHLQTLKKNGVDVEKVWADILAFKPGGVEVAAPVAKPEPSLAKSLLEGERAMKLTEYRILTGRMVIEANRAADRSSISTHDGINLGRLATDIAALAAVIESLDRCIASCE